MSKDVARGSVSGLLDTALPETPVLADAPRQAQDRLEPAYSGPLN
ncbi:MAG TPA: hypothetical protein VIE65_00875 [Methylobacter sp.]